MTMTAPTRPPSAAARATLVALAAATLLSACGGGGDAPPAGPSTLVVTGSTSSVAAAAAPAWRERLLAWLLPGAAHAAPATAGSPTVLRLRFHSLRISPNDDCSGPSIHQTLPLTAPLVVPGRTTLYVDATNGLLGDVEDGIGFCVVEAGVMGFR